MKTTKIFIVEDDEWYAEILNYHLSANPDYETHIYKSGKELKQNLYKNPDIITLDYSLPDTSGEVLLKEIKDFNPDIPVVVISGQEDIGTAVNLLKEGAYDYLIKDEETTTRIWKLIQNIEENISLKKEIKQLKSEVKEKYDFKSLIKGNSKAIGMVFNLIEKACNTNITVSVTGETGTGKELVAKAIHYNSDRDKQPFVAINMAAIPSELIESELFGHEKGAFTGAHSRKIGYFEQANKGTIFLDEIGDLNLNLQAKLLRVLQEREVVRVGGDKKIKIDTRLIVATHRDLAEEVKNGTFRSDLFYRLLGLPIKLPPLRDRENDVLLLAKTFTELFCKENKMETPSISKEALNKLKQYHYPGNIRELKAIIELAVVQSDSKMIEEDNIIFHTIDNMNDLLLQEKTLKQYNIEIVNYFLDKYKNDIPLIAQKLDIGKSTIYSMKQKGDITF